MLLSWKFLYKIYKVEIFIFNDNKKLFQYNILDFFILVYIIIIRKGKTYIIR